MQEEGSIRRSHTCNESRTTCNSEQKLTEGGAFFGHDDSVMDPYFITSEDYNLDTKTEGGNSPLKKEKRRNIVF